MRPPYDITGLILAGGRSRRMGRDKTELTLGGRTLTEITIEHLKPFCRELIVVTRRPTDFLDHDCKIVRDLDPGQGPLGGLITGLFYAHYKWCLTLGCDLPFLKPAVLELIADKTLTAKAGARALVPRTSDGWQPLVAAYARECLKPARRFLEGGERKLDRLAQGGVVWEAIAEEEIRALDPDLSSFINLNTPEELAKARALYGDGESFIS